jgi:hypothetical protein
MYGRRRWTVLETATNTGATRTERASVARVRALFERCAERESVSDSDWAYEKDGFFYREFADGILAKTTVDGDVVLYRVTKTTCNAIARGPPAEIERDTREFVLFGPPGGLDDGAGPRSWEIEGGSLHATTIGGVFRLMLQPDGRGTLLYIRNSFDTDVLGDDDVETLKRTADDLRRRHRGDPLRVRVAGEHVELHGVGLLGVVGQAELLRGTRLVLVLGDDDDQFDLYFVHRAGTCEHLCSYSGADLRRGDLGSIFGPRPVPTAESVRTSPSPTASDGPAPPRSRGRAPPHLGRSTPSRATNRAPPRTTRPVLTDDDARRLETCLTPDEEKWTGDGVTTLPYFFAAFDILIRQRTLKNLRLWCPAIRTLMKEEASVTVPGCERTFARGFALFVGITGLGTKHGRQWDIPCADYRRSGSAGMIRIGSMHEPAPARDTASSAPASPPGVHAPPTATPPIGSALRSPDVSTPTAAHTTPITHATPTTTSASAATPESATHARSATPQMPATAAALAVTLPPTTTPTATPAASTIPVRPTTPLPPATATASAVMQPFTSTRVTAAPGDSGSGSTLAG